jgi:hypothetical protein
MGSIVELSIHTFVDATVQWGFDMAEKAAGSALEAGTHSPLT